ncbi:MAG: tRNA pseudouridine(38-40) synthase TruA [Epulopiscium sp. Nele67-Bin005]|nr:MAG: tRNA pseudouridine(38-40) synthase TruA [Epulopiscium sp. Nele67-Bin005]
MKKLKIIVAYKGTNYHGFARQPNGITIQECLEKAIFDLTGQKIEVLGAGRTDTGVHAKAQCCMAILDTKIPITKFASAMNAKLPKDIVVQSVEEADENFHPRFNAKRKTYRYQILNSKQNNPFIQDIAYFYPYNLDFQKMVLASIYIEGTHDFKCFCSSNTQVKSTTRTVYSLNLKKDEQGLITIDICGNGFLYNMVRIIVGTLIEIGRGVIPPDDMKMIIESQNRNLSGPTAPPQGLMMYNIEY